MTHDLSANQNVPRTVKQPRLFEYSEVIELNHETISSIVKKMRVESRTNHIGNLKGNFRKSNQFAVDQMAK